MKLYELAEEYNVLSAMLDQEDTDPQAVMDTLESLTGEFEEKADNLACIIKGCLSDAEALKNEAAALAARQKKKEAKADRITKYLYQQMSAVGKKRDRDHPKPAENQEHSALGEDHGHERLYRLGHDRS